MNTETWWEVLLKTTIGALRSSTATAHGSKASAMAIRIATINTVSLVCVLFGHFDIIHKTARTKRNDMNVLFAKIVSLLKSDQYGENTIDLFEPPISTAAVPGSEEPEQLHQGKRRLKESYTSHWDLDYLPRKEVDKILVEMQNRNT